MPSFDELLNEMTSRPVDERLIILETISRSLESDETVTSPHTSQSFPMSDKQRLFQKAMSSFSLLIIIISGAFFYVFPVTFSSNAPNYTAQATQDRVCVWLALMLIIILPYGLVTLLTLKRLPESARGLGLLVGIYLGTIVLLLAQVSSENIAHAFVWIIGLAAVNVLLTLMIWVYRGPWQRSQRSIWFKE